MLTSICETGLNHLTANLTKMEIERRMMKNECGEEQYSKTTPQPKQTVQLAVPAAGDHSEL